MFIRTEKGEYMNKQESDILNALLIEPFINQRILTEVSGHSLGVVNRSLKELIKLEYIRRFHSTNSKSDNRTQTENPTTSYYSSRGLWHAYGSNQYGNAKRTA